MALAGCGDTVNNYYTSDDDSAQEETSPGNSSGNVCGDSPLIGRYLLQDSCKLGMVRPFQSNCTGELQSAQQIWQFTYQGNELTTTGSVYLAGEAEPLPAFLRLRRNISPSDFTIDECYGFEADASTPEGQARVDATNAYQSAVAAVEIQRFLCYLETNGDAYHGQTREERICPHLQVWVLLDEPWTGERNSCRDTQLDISWKGSCDSQYPYPNRCDYEGQCTE